MQDRWNKNKLTKIVDDSGIEHEGHSNISLVAVNYLQNLYNSQHVLNCPDLSGLNTISEEDSCDLIAPFSPEDVLATFKSMAKDKSPGPDGISSEFFVKTWEVVGSDTTAAILRFFDTGHLPRIINSSAIALIPKLPNASHMSQFRPISCCNVLHKCITKMMAFLMQKVMGILISNNQTAFVPKRNLSDNIFLAQALCRDYHQNSGPPKFACKSDIRKAFDTVN